jgi:hypothetical protein
MSKLWKSTARHTRGGDRPSRRRSSALWVLAYALLAGVLLAAGAIGASGSPSLDQCANGPTGTGTCSAATDWVNGNLNSSKARYNEGDSIAYRLKMPNLPAGTHTAAVEWDTTKSGKHAIDYLTSFNRTVGGANPCAGVSGCSSATTWPIPQDPNVPFTQSPGAFSLFGGTITGVSPYGMTGAYSKDSATRITITFTMASAGTAVLAWGGHIANHIDWPNASAVNITGSPFHTRLVGVDGSGGNQDLALSNDAVVFPASVKIVKHADGETRTFGFSASPAPLSSFSLTDGATVADPTQTFTLSQPSQFTTYTVSETDPSPRYKLVSVACQDPTQDSTWNGNLTATIKVGEGEEITCTFTNSQQPGTLTVKKVVRNDNGGTKTAADFSFKINDGNPIKFEADGQNDVTVAAGTYTVTEPATDGYSATYNNCNVQIEPGGTATCTITNDDGPGTLIVKKVVVNNDGGTKAASDFSFKVNGGSATQFEADGQNDVTVGAGTYSVTEPDVAGYSATYDNCSNVVVPNGGTVTCTITNDDRPGTLIVKKVVTNDSGGSKVASDFSFQVDGGDAVSFQTGGQNSITVRAGAHTVTETASAGYMPSYSNCTDVVVPNGGTATCTITNDDLPGTLVVEKVVLNDNGGTLGAADFSFKVDGGSAIAFDADGENEITVDAGAHSVTEPKVTGYAASYSSDCSNVVVPNGGSATCTITNDDQPGTIIVKKTVTNNDGGRAVASDFTLTVNNSAAPSPFVGSEAGTPVSVNAGDYAVLEADAPGYDPSYSPACDGTIALGETKTCTVTNDDQPGTLVVEKVVKNDDGGSKAAADFSFKVNGGNAQSFDQDGENELTVDAGTYSVTEPASAGYTPSYDNCEDVVVPNGETKTCTITNDDQPATLIVKKVVKNDNGGTLGASDFSFSVNDADPVAFEQDGENELTVDAGTYSVTEPASAGYSASYDTCDDVVLANGGSATCTITNDDRAAKLIVEKVVVNDNGDSAVASDFTLGVLGVNPTPDSFAGSESGTTVTLDAGDYEVFESDGPSGYTAGYSDDCAGTIGIGETKTCTVTNDDSKAASSGSTEQRMTPNDTVTITGRSPSGGEVTFELFDPGHPTCAGNPAWSEVAVLGDGTAGTHNETFVATQPGTWRWRVTYEGDNRNEPWEGDCGAERFVIANQ